MDGAWVPSCLLPALGAQVTYSPQWTGLPGVSLSESLTSMGSCLKPAWLVTPFGSGGCGVTQSVVSSVGRGSEVLGDQLCLVVHSSGSLSSFGQKCEQLKLVTVMALRGSHDF